MNEKPTLYLLDDNEANLEILIWALKDDFEICAGLEAAQALEDIPRLQPDLLLLDVNMPEMSGFELCRRLKEIPAVKDIPVIFITAMDSLEDEVLGFKLGAVDFISKPISPPQVKARVKTHVELRLSQRRLARLSEKLSRYLSPSLYNSIFEGKRDVQLETTRKKLTIFFSDIVGFAACTDQLEAEDLNYILNSYLECMSKIILKHGGVLDKFIGDAILVFFGDPESRGVEEDAEACVRMAMEMQTAVRKLRIEWAKQGINLPFSVRMGISSGYCTVGNFGCLERMDYTVIGGQVNLASRLQSRAEPGHILVSSETWSLVKDKIYCESKGEMSIEGFAYPLLVFEAVDLIENHDSVTDEIVLDTQGFSMKLDPNQVSEQEREKILSQLRRALNSMDNVPTLTN
ncbi:MAG: response regulator [Gammaproteobacteria bacterium]|nr:response regulator [Gammaproteobacteria bacterium]